MAPEPPALLSISERAAASRDKVPKGQAEHRSPASRAPVQRQDSRDKRRASRSQVKLLGSSRINLDREVQVSDSRDQVDPVLTAQRRPRDKDPQVRLVALSQDSSALPVSQALRRRSVPRVDSKGPNSDLQPDSPVLRHSLDPKEDKLAPRVSSDPREGKQVLRHNSALRADSQVLRHRSDSREDSMDPVSKAFTVRRDSRPSRGLSAPPQVCPDRRLAATLARSVPARLAPLRATQDRRPSAKLKLVSGTSPVQPGSLVDRLRGTRQPDTQRVPQVHLDPLHPSQDRRQRLPLDPQQSGPVFQARGRRLRTESTCRLMRAKA